ncbi:MAG: hypothetical protein LBT87_08940 [Treponema sp.]|jgi:hypothetical protein|nr:hypothetical protein [Treponema sp.]
MRLPDKPGGASYRKFVEAIKKRHRSLTVADAVAASALPLPLVQELLPQAADEYSARLEVTESGEILYTFPRIFTSRYRGFKAGLKRFFANLGRTARIAAVWFFKVWIMIMLVGYFLLFMLIALAALMVSVAGSSSSNSDRRSRNSGGGFYLVSGIFDLVIRIWFYSELTRSLDRAYSGNYGEIRERRPKGRPLHQAIFSFVFGEPDPNREAESVEKKTFIAWLQQNSGLISLPEYMSLTGKPLPEAEEGILAACSEFGGMPEVTGEGTIVYRFDRLLLRSDRAAGRGSGTEAPLKQLKRFSTNKKSLNNGFALINTVNLFFGAYFFYHSLFTGPIPIPAPRGVPWIYGFVYGFSSQLSVNPLPLITLGLGLVPLAFSILFWLIPALRYFREKRENQGIKLENLRKIGFQRIWSKLRGLRAGDIQGPSPEASPQNLPAAQDRIIKDMAAYSMPELETDTSGNPIYNFIELEREKEDIIRCRAGIRPGDSELGKTIFDSGN